MLLIFLVFNATLLFIDSGKTFCPWKKLVCLRKRLYAQELLTVLGDALWRKMRYLLTLDPIYWWICRQGFPVEFYILESLFWSFVETASPSVSLRTPGISHHSFFILPLLPGWSHVPLAHFHLEAADTCLASWRRGRKAGKEMDSCVLMAGC